MATGRFVFHFHSRATVAKGGAAVNAGVVVSGGHSPIHETTCDVLAERLGGERAVIQGRGHAVQRTGKEFNRVLQEFVLRVGASSA